MSEENENPSLSSAAPREARRAKRGAQERIGLPSRLRVDFADEFRPPVSLCVPAPCTVSTAAARERGFERYDRDGFYIYPAKK